MDDAQGLSPQGPVPDAAVKQALARIVRADGFRSAPQLSRFLTYVVDETLAGNAASIRGFTIATEALGRGRDFDPQADPIVRVEAGRLRRALQAYYQGPGRNEAVVISVPLGRYAPRFTFRETDGVSADVPTDAIVPDLPPAAGQRRMSLRSALAVLPASALMMAVLLAIAGLVHSREPSARADHVEHPILIVAAEHADDLVQFRRMLVGALSRFHDVVVRDGPPDDARPPPERASDYRLSVRQVPRSAGATLALQLTHVPDGAVAWSRNYPMPHDPAQEEQVVAQVAAALARPAGILVADRARRRTAPATLRCLAASARAFETEDPAAIAAAARCLSATPESEVDASLSALRARIVPRTPPSAEVALQDARRTASRWPDSAFVQSMVAVALVAAGELREALAQGEDARRLNPDDPDVLADLGRVLIANEQYDAGMAAIDRSEAIRPLRRPSDSYCLFVGALMRGDTGRMRQAASRLAGFESHAPALQAQALAAAAAGDAATASSLLRRLAALPKGDLRSAWPATPQLPPQAVARIDRELHRIEARIAANDTGQ